MVRGRARGGKGSLCPPTPPNTPNRPTWTPPPTTLSCPTWTPPPTDPPGAPPPLAPPIPPPFALPNPPPFQCPSPQGASGQQLVGGVVGVQNRGVAPPPPPPVLVSLSKIDITCTNRTKWKCAKYAKEDRAVLSQTLTVQQVLSPRTLGPSMVFTGCDAPRAAS